MLSMTKQDFLWKILISH